MRPTIATTFVAFATLAMAATSTHAAGSATVKLWRLDCGTIQVNDLSLFSDAFDYQGRKLTLTDSCYLIAHGKDYMLWDTGLPVKLLKAPLSADAPMAPTLDRTLPDQLQAIGVTPAEIAIIGISHYHFDHLSQAADFPQAKLMIGRADLDAMKMEPAPFGAEPDLVAPWLKGQSAPEPVSGDKDIYGDGTVVMLAMPGHTPGSYALLVRLARMGPVLLSGDVVHFEEQLATNNVPPFNTDRAQSLASMDRLKHIVKTLKAVLVVQHDAADIKKLPAFPQSAE